MTPKKPAIGHSLAEAKRRFNLIDGVGDGETTACAMSALAWVDGCPEWTDHPDCALPLLADMVIRANDAGDTTKEQRWELVKLGQLGVLDTWWIPGEVIALSLAGERDAEPLGLFDLAVRSLKRIAAWKKEKQRPNLQCANLRSADLQDANLQSADLQSADLQYANLQDANLRSANLQSADLRYANLRSANLQDANLRGANLRGATGSPLFGMPDGWKLDASGFWVKK